MSKINFVYEGISTEIQCSKDDKMKDICNNFKNKINLQSSVVYLSGGKILNLNLKYKDYQKNDQTMKIYVIKNEEEENQNNQKSDSINNIISAVIGQNDYINELRQLIQNIFQNKLYNHLKFINPILDQLTEGNKNIIEQLNKISKEKVEGNNKKEIKIEIKNEIKYGNNNESIKEDKKEKKMK